MAGLIDRKQLTSIIVNYVNILMCALLLCSAATASAQNVSHRDSLVVQPEVLRMLFRQSVTYRVVEQSKPVAADYYTKQLGFFCRQELKMQQKNIPVTFRLGSMTDCNRLEGKPGYR